MDHQSNFSVIRLFQATWDKVILQENNVVVFCMQVLLYHQTNSFTISTTLFGSSSRYMEHVVLFVFMCVVAVFKKQEKDSEPN